MTDERLAALLEDERRSDVLLGLSEFAERAARAACARADSGTDPGWETRSILSVVIMVLLETAARLAMLSWRVWQGRGLPVRRPGTAEQAGQPGRPAAAPRKRSAWEEARFADLAALGVPGADGMRAELAALLADPGTAALVSSEPSVWRAAFRLARAFGLPVPPRPKTAEPEPPAASSPPGTAGPARPRPRRPEPPPEGWFEYAAGAGPVILPFARPEPASDPPPLRLKPLARLQDLRPRLLRPRLLRSAIGWA